MTDSHTSTNSHASTQSHASIKIETRSDASSRKTQVRWSSEMEAKMVKALHKEVDSGGKTPDNRWKPEVLKSVAKLVMETTAQDVRSEHIRARLKTLKKDWALAYACINKSGFGIDNTTGGIDADPIAWAEYVKANPTADALRYKKFPFYNELCLIFGKDYATGSICIEGHDVETPPLSIHNKSMIDILDDDEAVDLFEKNREAAAVFQSLPEARRTLLVHRKLGLPTIV